MSGEHQDLEEFFGSPPLAAIASAPNPVEQDPEEEETSPAAETRHSLLSPPGRAALQKLLTRGVVLSRTHPDEFAHLVGGKVAIDQIMASLGLSMQVHPDYGMAVVYRIEDLDAEAGVDDPDGDDEEGGSALVRISRLNVTQSLVLMVLRIYYRERERAGDKHVIIELANLKERLEPFWPMRNAEARSDRRFNGAVRKLQDHGILMSVRGKEDLREVSPVIVLALGSEKLAVLISEYTRLAGVHVKQEGVADDGHE